MLLALALGDGRIEGHQLSALTWLLAVVWRVGISQVDGEAVGVRRAGIAVRGQGWATVEISVLPKKWRSRLYSYYNDTSSF